MWCRNAVESIYVCVCVISSFTFIHLYLYNPVYMLKLSSPDESPQQWDPPHCG